MSLKDEILRMLDGANGACVSGEELAGRLSVSRAAVWKAVRALRTDGYEIEAATNRGYRLLSAADVLTPASILPFLKNDSAPVYCRHALGSTNSEAMRLAIDGAPHGTVVLAEEQSAGRGRRGRAFFSPPRSGLYMSLIFRPQAARGGGFVSATAAGRDAADVILLTVAAAVAVCEAIEALTPRAPKIKWVNDILLDGKKVCGILTEAVGDLESASVACLVVGIGVNLTTPEDGFPEELRAIAASLGGGLPRGRLAAEIANRLFDRFDDLSNPAMLDAYRARSVVLGRRVRYVEAGRERVGNVVGINDRGNLVLESDEGTSVLQAGEIFLMERAG